MKKKLIMSSLTAAMLLTASSAFAFNNDSAGYMINNKVPVFAMQSSKMYGYVDAKEEALHVISHFNSQEMTKVAGEKFSTAYFNNVCDKLATLKQNEANAAIAKMPLLNLENYAKLDPSNKAILEKGIEPLNKLIPTIKVTKVAGNKAISMSLYAKDKDDIYNTNVTLLSVNDMLYMLMTGGELDTGDATKSSANQKASANADNLDKAKAAIKDIEFVDVSKLDPKAVAKANAMHNKFVKQFKVFAPAKDKAAAVAFTDMIANKTVQLPDGWCYAQYNKNEKVKPAVATVLLPADTLGKVVDKLVKDDMLNGKKIPANESEMISKLGEAVLSQVSDFVITGSCNLGFDKEVADALANPSATKLQLDVMFQSGLKEIQKLGGPFMKLNSYKYNNDITKELGVVTVNADVTLLRKVDFLTRVKLVGNPKLAMAALQIHNKAANIDKNAAAIYESWQF